MAKEKKSDKKKKTSLAEALEGVSFEAQAKLSKIETDKAELAMAKSLSGPVPETEITVTMSIKRVMYKSILIDLKEYLTSKAPVVQKESLILFICTAAFNQDFAKVLSKLLPKDIIDRKLWTDCEYPVVTAAVIGNLILSIDIGIMSPVIKNIKSRWMKVNGGYSCCFTAFKIGILGVNSASTIAMATASKTFTVSDQIEIKKLISANIPSIAFTDKSYFDGVITSFISKALLIAEKYSPVGAEYINYHVSRIYKMVRKAFLIIIVFYYFFYTIPYVWNRKGILKGVIDASSAAFRVSMIIVFGGVEQMMWYLAIGIISYVMYSYSPFSGGVEDKASEENVLVNYTKLLNAMKENEGPLDDIRLGNAADECEDDFGGSTLESATEMDASGAWEAASAPAGGFNAHKKRKGYFKGKKKTDKEKWKRGESIPDVCV